MDTKTVLITGASSGIGEATARLLAEKGYRLLICARRLERLEKLAMDLKKEVSADVYPFKLDLSNRHEIEEACHVLPQEWKRIDVLINNAGNAHGLDLFQNADLEDFDRMIDINLKGLLFLTHHVIQGMLKRGEGHIINIGSIAGHEVYPKGVVYCATKFALKAITEGLKKDLHGTPIRVTSIDPGLVETEFSLVRFKQDKERAKKVYEGMKVLQPDDVAEAIAFALSRPEHVNIRELILMPTAQSSAQMVQRKET